MGKPIGEAHERKMMTMIIRVRDLKKKLESLDQIKMQEFNQNYSLYINGHRIDAGMVKNIMDIVQYFPESGYLIITNTGVVAVSKQIAIDTGIDTRPAMSKSWRKEANQLVNKIDHTILEVRVNKFAGEKLCYSR